MKRFLLSSLMIFAACSAQATDVGVSVSVGEPGFYGRIDVGSFPEPEVIYTRPVTIEHVTTEVEPIYLRIPPGHEKHWKKYCHRYHACNRPVYFVRDSWYNRVYVPRYREREEWRERDHHHGHQDEHHGDQHYRHEDYNDRYDAPHRDHDDEHGNDHDHGHGHDHDHGHWN